MGGGLRASYRRSRPTTSYARKAPHHVSDPGDVAVGLDHVHKTYGGEQPVVALDDVSAVAGQRVPHVPAAGWAAVVGGTVVLALVATVLPVGRLLRTPPVEGIGVRE